jgi:2-dehydropantoate 2-reductase
MSPDRWLRKPSHEIVQPCGTSFSVEVESAVLWLGRSPGRVARSPCSCDQRPLLPIAIACESKAVVLGTFEVAVRGTSALEGEVDVLWVATKATELERALSLAPPEAVRDAVVVPLLNGIDHLAVLRRRYREVVGAAIRVESERIAPGVIRQASPFLRVDMAGAEEVQATLREAGFECRARDDGTALLWEKLVFLAPIALATTALDAPVGEVRDDPSFSDCRSEVFAAASAAGAHIDLGDIRGLHTAAPAEMQSSMQKDVAAGREPELEAIAGPVTRLGREHGFPTHATEYLADRIRARVG